MSRVIEGKNGPFVIPDRWSSKDFWEASEAVFKLTLGQSASNIVGLMLAQAAATEAALEAKQVAGGATW